MDHLGVGDFCHDFVGRRVDQVHAAGFDASGLTVSTGLCRGVNADPGVLVGMQTNGQPVFRYNGWCYANDDFAR